MGWTTLTSIKGPMGAQGPTGPQGEQGIDGPPGQDGAGVAISGQVATYADLPTSATPGDGWLVDADGLLYVWTGTTFPSEGQGVEFRGPVGPTGPQGPVGATGPQGVQGETGPQGETGAKGDQGEAGAKGDTGAKGDKGDQGDTGATGTDGTNGVRGTMWFSASGGPIAHPEAFQPYGAMTGDLYLDTSDGTVYVLS